MLKNNIFINEVGLFRFGLAFSPAKQFFLKNNYHMSLPKMEQKTLIMAMCG